MAIFVKEYDWMWNTLGLSPAECRVYAYIYGLTNSKHSSHKGYNGSVRQLAKDLGLNAGHTSRVLTALEQKQLLSLADGIYTSVALNNTSVALSNESVALNNESVALNNTPHTPLYIESQKEINNKPAYQKDRRRRQEVDVDSLALFTQYYQMFPHKAKNNAIKQQAQNEFVALSRDTQQAILTQLQKRLTAGIPLLDTSPLMYIRHFDPDAPPDKPPQIEQPTNYNHGTPPPDAKPALYNGEWGMYTPEDIDKFDLLTKEKMNQSLNQEQ